MQDEEEPTDEEYGYEAIREEVDEHDDNRQP